MSVPSNKVRVVVVQGRNYNKSLNSEKYILVKKSNMPAGLSSF